jgi:hypothetical protein
LAEVRKEKTQRDDNTAKMLRIENPEFCFVDIDQSEG